MGCSIVYRMMLAFLLLLASGSAEAQYRQAELPLNRLPTEHEYQRELRDFLATLTKDDLAVELRPVTAVTSQDPEERYRLWILAQQLPNVSAVAMPAEAFTLPSIESRQGLQLPAPVTHSQSLAWLANWAYPGNPYHGSRALKLRAFVLAAVDVMMLDYLYEHAPQGADRSDYLGGNLIWIGYTYNRIRDSLPPRALAPFETGIKKHVLRLNDWGPKGIMVDMDMFASVGLRYIHDATRDAEVKAIAERYVRALFTEDRYFHPAGYFTDSGCFDTSYNGISLYFGTWCALMSDWGFAHRAMDQAYRLRAHLSFPDLKGNFSGPSHMSSRTSADPPHDQWQFTPRHCAAGMISDHALYLCPVPSAKAFDAAPQTIAATLNRQLASPIPPDFQPWRETHWSREINFAYEHYRKGHYERLLTLVKLNSPLLKSPYQRDETFIHEFAKAFIIAKFPAWGGAIHTGPVGKAIGNLGLPYGYGGGQLSGFWTPSTGAALLGRRRGAQGHVYDTYAEWRNWPIHAVTGLTEAGELVSSSRIVQPELKSAVGRDHATIRVSGVMPKYNADRTAIGPSGLQYQRQFRLGPDGIHVTTTVTSSAPERMTELYETIPIFLREQEEKPAIIWFQIGNTWEEASPEPRSAVRAVRVDRFTGSILITFSRPCTVKLSPQVWRDGFQTQAECRTVLVDLIGEQPRPCLLRSASVEYTIRPGPRADTRAHLLGEK